MFNCDLFFFSRQCSTGGTNLCVSSVGSPGLSSQCTQPAMGGSESICLPTSRHLVQSGGEVVGLSMQENHSDCSGLAQHALVLGSSGHVQLDPTKPAQPAHTTIQSDSREESFKPKSTCVVPRASAIKEQGFSEAVAARIEAPQRGSTRSVYESSGPSLQSGASVLGWTSGHLL